MTSYSGRWEFKAMSASPAPAPRCPSLNPPNLYYLIWQKRFFLLMWFWLRIWTWEIIPGCLGGLSLITWVLKSERQQSEWVGDLDKGRRGQGRAEAPSSVAGFEEGREGDLESGTCGQPPEVGTDLSWEPAREWRLQPYLWQGTKFHQQPEWTWK